jgi:molecular chaperone GrpE
MPNDMPDQSDQFSETNNDASDQQTTCEDFKQKWEEAEYKAKQYWERILRMQADAENANKRTERDLANAYKYALEKFVTELLPIIDSLELCTTTVDDAQGLAKSVIDGVHLTLKMFYTALGKFGIEQVNPITKPFDAEYHQAISVETSNIAEPGTVISVLQKGYTLNNRLIRPALVVVAKAEE